MQDEVIVLDPRKSRCVRLRRTVMEAAKLHERDAEWASQRLGRSAYRKTFITLTYRPGEKWEPRHISRFIRLMRQWFKRRDYPCHFAWVAELQKRGALHYHVLVWVPRRLRLPRPDVAGWWPFGMSNLETARNPVGYMVKYATKTRPEDLRRLPKGVRLHGNGGHRPENRVRLRERLWPHWINEAWNQRGAEETLAKHAEQEAWELRRVEEYFERPDGTRCMRYIDPLGEPTDDERIAHYEAEQERLELWQAYAAKYGPRGLPKLQRVTGGFVDLLTGELIPTPWRVVVDRGVVTIHRRPETTPCM